MDFDESPPPRHGGQLVAGEAGDDAYADGLTIQDYAQKFGVPTAEVWRKLRRGELIGRTELGRLMIYVTAEAAEVLPPGHDRAPPFLSSPSGPEPSGVAPDAGGGSSPDPRLADADPDQAGAEATLPLDFILDLADEAADELPHPDQDTLPPLPPDADQTGTRSGAVHAVPAVSHERGAPGTPLSTELALLLDHLSLAKDENREILRMTTESIRKVSELSDTIVEMKDTVIDAKEAEILALREQLAARDQEVRRLRQLNEDLEMLARTIVTEAKAPR